MNAYQAVRRGVKLLDQAMPGWWRPGKIKLNKLNLADCDVCILGQLYDDGTADGFAQGRLELQRLADIGMLKLPRGSEKYADGDGIDPGQFGFDMHNNISYHTLDRVWADEIRVRRRAAHLKIDA